MTIIVHFANNVLMKQWNTISVNVLLWLTLGQNSYHYNRKHAIYIHSEQLGKHILILSCHWVEGREPKHYWIEMNE